MLLFWRDIRAQFQTGNFFMGRIQGMPRQGLEMIKDHAAPSGPDFIGNLRFKKLVSPVAPEMQKKIWIDIDNSPHVPFFIPIIEELQKRGHHILLTARDTYQVCELLEFHHLDCKVVGSHWGKNRFLKTLGTLGRAARLARPAFGVQSVGYPCGCDLRL
jgi:Protein of unknown function (DUF354)